MELQIVEGLPFTLPDGTIVLPEVNSSGSKIVSQQENEAEEEIDEVLEDLDFSDHAISLTRTLADVPIDHKSFTVHMAIAAMVAWGLNDFSIAAILNTDEQSVTAYREEDIHAQLLKQTIEGIRHAETSSIHGYLSQQAKKAAVVVAAELKSRDADRRMTAAKDVLDRTGFRPADRVEHVHSFENELRITITKPKEAKTITLDI